MTDELFFSVKTKDPASVQKILNKEADIEMSGLNILESYLKIGQLVFIVLGGDKPAWETGLVGIGVISKEPYDQRYDKKNYRINIDMKILLHKAIKRVDLIPFSDTYGTIGIAPITSWEPNQALSQISPKKAVALMRAMLEIDRTIYTELSMIINSDMMKQVTGLTNKSVQIPTLYGENEQTAIIRYLKNQNNTSIIVPPTFTTNIICDLPRNWIVFGAPGTGKSFSVNNELENLLHKFGVGDDNYERVTFHADYSYANFVGTYKPVMVDSDPNIDDETKAHLDILKDQNKSAQEKYDFFYDNAQDIGLSRIPVLIGITTDEPFHTKKSDGSNSADDNIVERNHGVALRKYVQLKDDGLNVKSSEISYEYVPGPFMRMYVKALKNAQNFARGTEEAKPFVLIIEEINRANVAAVFGDVFQLLDRKNNVSEYPIQASEDIKKYLAKELGGKPENYAKIKIPDNLFIWSTMNSADQGVFPMDTAFKRRWDFTYLGIDDNERQIQGNFVYLGKNKDQKVEWNKLRKAINDFLAQLGINEDKQLGPYFISKNVISAPNNIINRNKFCEVFRHKVIMYLFEDAAKQKRATVFSEIGKENLRYSKICDAFDKKGILIFNKEIQEKCGYTTETEPETQDGVYDEW